MKKFKTYQMALEFYKKSKEVEISDKILKDQFRRSSLSIVLNIAKGYGRSTTKDRRRFYVMAFGSLRETQCLLEVLGENNLIIEADRLAACLLQLCKKPGSLFPEL